MARVDPDRLVRDLARRVAELRRERGWSQADLAEALACSVQRVAVIEGGSANLTLHTLARLATIFGLPVADLFKTPKNESKKVGPGRPRVRRD